MMDEFHKEEIESELRQEARDEAMNIWIDNNRDWLVEEFLTDNEEFVNFCRKKYEMHKGD